MKTPILGSAYVARSVNAADNRMVNLFPEIIPEGGKEAAFLSRTPGLRLYRTVGNGPVRGMWSFGGDLYVVSGTGLYKVGDEPLTAARDGAWLSAPDDCGITAATNITGSGTITLEMTDAGGYQFTVGSEVWPEVPSPWTDIVAGSPHAFALATLTFADTPPVTPPNTCDPNAPALTGLTVLTDPYPESWPGTTMRSTALAGTDTKIVAIGSRRTAIDFDLTVAVYDIASDTWTQKADCSAPIFAESPYAFTVDQDTVLLYGYNAASYTNYLYKYTLSTDTWTALTADTAQPRYRAYAAWNDGKLYLLGGIDPYAAVITNTGGYSISRVYDLATDTWSNGPVVSDSDKCFGAATVFRDGKMILVGGGNGSGSYNSVRTYDPTLGTVQSVGSIPVGAESQDFAAASTGEGLYVACRGVSPNRLYRVSFADWSSANVLVDNSGLGGEPSLVRAGACALYMTSSGSSLSNFVKLS